LNTTPGGNCSVPGEKDKEERKCGLTNQVVRIVYIYFD
jgi:hypothetical protein